MFLFLVTPYLSCSVLHGVNPNFFKKCTVGVKHLLKIYLKILCAQAHKVLHISLPTPECAVWHSACLCVCVISNQSAIKKPHYVSDLSKRDVLLHKTHIKVLLVYILKVPRLNMCRSIISLSKTAHLDVVTQSTSVKETSWQKSSESDGEEGVRGNREKRGVWTKFDKEG